jgi:enoyl-CoA hydratase
MAESASFSLAEDGIAFLTINRPHVRNALDWAAMELLGEAVTEAERAAGSLRALVVSGAGDQAFISGGDLRDLHDRSGEQAGLEQHDLMSGILRRMSALPVPVIAALEGAARGGGCEVALACDLRIASESATLGFAQVNMAVSPGWGGAERLIRLVGYAAAFDLLITGRTVDAHEASSLGLVSYLCPAGKALHMAGMVAGRIAEAPPLAVQGIKSVLQAYSERPLDEARGIERATFGRLWATADHAEAVAAFLAGREPVFRGE